MTAVLTAGDPDQLQKEYDELIADTSTPFLLNGHGKQIGLDWEVIEKRYKRKVQLLHLLGKNPPEWNAKPALAPPKSLKERKERLQKSTPVAQKKSLRRGR